MKKVAVLLLTGAIGLSLASCADNPSPSPSVSPEQGSELNPYVGNTYSQQPDVRDYAYSWWPEGTGTAPNNKFFVQTGYYGISVNGSNGMINRIGALKDEYSQSEVMTQNASVINSLPQVSTFSSVKINDDEYVFTDIIEPAQYNTINMRIIESGQYMQSFDAAAMIFADSSGKRTNSFIGRTEIKALPEYFALNFQLFAQHDIADATLTYSFEFSEEMTGSPSQNGREIILRAPDGSGLSIILPSQNASLSYEQASKTLTMSCSRISLKQYEFQGFGAIIIPSVSPSQADIEQYNAIASLNISASQIAPREGREVPVQFDADRGVWVMNTNRMVSAKGTAFAQEQNQNACDRVSFTIQNPSEQTITVPLMFEKSGAFTGEISADMLVDLGVEYVIVGHSERRQYYNETDFTVNKKVHAALEAGLYPIVCVGETLEERESGVTEKVVSGQTRAALRELTEGQARACIIAYEPIWAIGTGRTATAAQADEVCGIIRAVVAGLYAPDTAEALTIQYGGSMNAANAEELLAKYHVDGGLIGGASLKAQDFATIVRVASK